MASDCGIPGLPRQRCSGIVARPLLEGVGSDAFDHHLVNPNRGDAQPGDRVAALGGWGWRAENRGGGVDQQLAGVDEAERDAGPVLLLRGLTFGGLCLVGGCVGAVRPFGA